MGWLPLLRPLQAEATTDRPQGWLSTSRSDGLNQREDCRMNQEKKRGQNVASNLENLSSTYKLPPLFCGKYSFPSVAY